MKTCKSCKFWDKYGENHGFCKSEKILHVSSVDATEIIQGDELIANTDYCGCSIYVGENFGCIHHEEKTNNENL